MRKPDLIGILGRAGSGKTTTGLHLVEKYGAQRLSFAEPLKRLAQHIMGFTDEQLYGTQAVKEAVDDRYGMSATQFLMKLGDGARNFIKYSVWCEAALESAYLAWQSEPEKNNLFVIDDTRYVNEAEAISTDPRFNGHVIKLECPDRQSNRDPNHPSEAQVDEVPRKWISDIIVSKRSPESLDLLTKVDIAVESLFPGIGKRDKSPFTTEPAPMP